MDASWELSPWTSEGWGINPTAPSGVEGCCQGHCSLPFLTSSRGNPVADKPAERPVTKWLEDTKTSTAGAEIRGKGQGHRASSVTCNIHPHANSLMYRCPLSRGGEGGGQTGSGPSQRGCPECRGAETYRLPVNQVDTTKVILPTKGAGDPQEEATRHVESCGCPRAGRR